MKVTGIKSVKTDVVVDIKCNKCGESLRPRDSDGDYYGLVEAKVTAGYYSPVFDDGVVYAFSLCEKCLKELFKVFKYDPMELSAY